MAAGGAAVAGAGRALFPTLASSPPAGGETGPVEYAECCRRLSFAAITASSLAGMANAMVRIERVSDRFGRCTRSREDAERGWNWRQAGKFEARFIGHAIDEAVVVFRREFPLPFRLETPHPV